MESEAGQAGAIALSAVGLVPYFGWGLYSLRLHFRYHEEFRPAVAAFTLGGVLFFYLIETSLLRVYLAKQPAFFIFALLGLFVSGAALYGNMVVSLISQLLVDAVAPGERSHTREPHYGPAEALERLGDYEGALEEFLVIARIFPREPKPVVKIAEMQIHLHEPEKAAKWFERAVRMIHSPEESLQVTNRACELYLRQLDAPMEAIRLLEDYLDRFPKSEFEGRVEDRIHRIEEQMAAPKDEKREAVSAASAVVSGEEGEGIPMLPSEQAQAVVEDEGGGIPLLPGSSADQGDSSDDGPRDTNQMPTL